MSLKTINFGAENLVFAPEGAGVSIYDLYHWRWVRLASHAVRLRLRPHALEHVRNSLRDLLGKYLKTPDGRANGSAIERDTERFLMDLIESAGRPEPASIAPDILQERSAPTQLTFWARLSDIPLETYFDEDYETQPQPAPSAFGLPLYGSIVVSRLGEGEIPIPDSGAGAGFLLELPGGEELTAGPIDPAAALPIVREFCGAGGASNQGNAANYALDSRLAREKLGCVPLHRVGRAAFATLYLHVETDLEYNVLVRIRGPRLRLAERKITSLGYRLASEGPMHRIWEREGSGDTLHVYVGIPGRESEMVPRLVPFVLAARAGGGFDPARRSKLIGELLEPVHAAD